MSQKKKKEHTVSPETETVSEYSLPETEELSPYAMVKV